jgi:hypothetical protein
LIQVNGCPIYWLLALGLLLHLDQQRVAFKGLLLLLLHHFLLLLDKVLLELRIKLVVPELILRALSDFCAFTQVNVGWALTTVLVKSPILMFKDLTQA